MTRETSFLCDCAIDFRFLVIILTGLLLSCQEANCVKTTITTTFTKEVSLDVPGIPRDLSELIPNELDAEAFAEDVDVNYLQRYRPAPPPRLPERKIVPTKAYTTQLEPTNAPRAAVRLFDNDAFEGRGSKVLYIDYGDCVDLTYDWRTKVTSIDTLGLCVLLWEDEGCNGSHTIIRGDEHQDPNASRFHSGLFASLELC